MLGQGRLLLKVSDWPYRDLDFGWARCRPVDLDVDKFCGLMTASGITTFGK